MLKTTDHGSIRELNMDRPPVNAFNPALVGALADALTDAFGQCRGVVISGRKGLFSAGLDVPELMTMDREGMARFWEAYFGLLEVLARSPVPVAAAITGHSPAGGAVVSLFCDYRVMSRGEYVFGLNETRVGLVVPEVIQNALVRLTGPHRAERLIVAGELLSPESALEAGIVDALADDPESAVSEAINWCEQLDGLPRHAMLGNRAMLRADLGRMFDTLGSREVELFVDGWFAEETQQVLQALVAKLKSRG
ncbi:MAG: enoyl-CoA hydratase/isomerase family protein [Xanthomonadales bacterium]|nr:enoyl-CoA hydratase/isomerase family protein [Xanthomonadales bacterium]